MLRYILIPPSYLLQYCCHSFLSACYNQSIHGYCYYFKQLSIRSTKNKKNKIGYFTFIYSFSDVLSLCRSQFLTHIIFLLSEEFFKKHFNISCRVGDLAMNSQFFFVWVFITSLLLKDNFTGYRILDWWFFSFNTLNFPFHTFLV